MILDNKSLTSCTAEKEDPMNDQPKPIDPPERKLSTPKEKLICHLQPTPRETVVTPDSELEDAASIAQSIIASEQGISSPIVTTATPPIVPTSNVEPQKKTDLCVDTSIPETPPVRGLVSLAQIGIIPTDYSVKNKVDDHPSTEPEISDCVKSVTCSDNRTDGKKEASTESSTIKTIEDNIKSESEGTALNIDDPKLVIPTEHKCVNIKDTIQMEKTEPATAVTEEVLKTTELATNVKDKPDTTQDDKLLTSEAVLKAEGNNQTEDNKTEQLPKETIQKKTPVKPSPPKTTDKVPTSSTSKTTGKSESKSDPPVPPPRKKEKKHKK